MRLRLGWEQKCSLSGATLKLAEDLAVISGAESLPEDEVDGAGDEAGVAVGEEGVDAAGVAAAGGDVGFGGDPAAGGIAVRAIRVVGIGDVEGVEEGLAEVAADPVDADVAEGTNGGNADGGFAALAPFVDVSS